MAHVQAWQGYSTAWRTRLSRAKVGLLVFGVLLGACGGSGGGDSLIDGERADLRGWWHTNVLGSTFEIGFFDSDLGQAARWRKRADGRDDEQSSTFSWIARPEGRLIIAEDDILTDDCPVHLLPARGRFRRDGRKLTLTDDITGEALTLAEGKVSRTSGVKSVTGCWDGGTFTPLK